MNGYMFILIGIYDWSQTPDVDAKTAAAYFNRGMITLKRILPYYDIGGISSYEMSHITYGRVPGADVNYHVLVLKLLHALNSVRPGADIERFETVWTASLLK